MSLFAGLNAEKYDRKYSNRELFSRIYGYFKPFMWKLIATVMVVLCVSLIRAVQPIAISKGLEFLENDKTLKIILQITGVIFGIGVFQWGLNWIRRRLSTRLIIDVITKLATDAFTASTEHDLSFYDEYASGRVVSRITSDTRDFGEMVMLSTDLISQIVEVVLLAIVLFGYDVRLTLYLFALVPFIFLLTISYRKLARRVTRDGMRAMAEVNAAIKETISGIAIAKNFRQEESIYEDFDKANNLSYRVNVRRGLVMSFVFPALNGIAGVATAILIYIGAISVIQGVVIASAWILFLQSLDRFMFPIMNLSSFITQIQTGLASAERVFALIDAEPAVKQNKEDPVDKIKGQIKFDHLNFSYKEGIPVLRDFSLDIKAGESIAFVGHTGAGKSSIAKLIARFYEYQSGNLLIDGQDIRNFELDSYRRNLGIVSQVPFLFSGTVLDNIRYANSNISEEEICAIANRIGDGEWVETLPHGFASEVGERGNLLSMGQRQLISLMRILVRKPAIFILDEATASIDPFTEWQIQQALNLILADTTSILIAHRLSTIKSADRIIVIENGEIIESGNHEGLLELNGHYAELYNTYFRHQSLAYIEQAKEKFSSASVN